MDNAIKNESTTLGELIKKLREGMMWSRPTASRAVAGHLARLTNGIDPTTPVDVKYKESPNIELPSFIEIVGYINNAYVMKRYLIHESYKLDGMLFFSSDECIVKYNYIV